MTTTAVQTETTALPTGTVDFKFEVAIIPVADADRTKRFYTQLGWREDADFPISEGHRVLQFTPPGSLASIIFGTGVTTAVPGSAENLLAVSNIDAARAELAQRGVEVSDVFHGLAFSDDEATRVPGPDPDRKSYGSYATFSDPDGNEWLLQEVTTRLPGRE
jgi:catechol 2,3-dioxygenase-like lactoylglutathione lyase family enzyme